MSGMAELKTVYVVTQGNYSEYHIVEVFADENEANQFAERLKSKLHGYGSDAVWVEEYDLASSKHNLLTEFPDEAYMEVWYYIDTDHVLIDVHDGVPNNIDACTPQTGKTITGVHWVRFWLPTSVTPETSGLTGGDKVEKSDRLMKIIRDRVAQIRWNGVSGDAAD